MDLYGGTNSVVNSVPVDATAFGKRDALWTIQFYASSSNDKPPYPSSGFTFLNGKFRFTCISYFFLMYRVIRHGQHSDE